MTRIQLLEELSTRIACITPPHPIRVAIDGVDGAGKTTLANELAQLLENCGTPVIRASIDAFHYPRAHRYRRGANSPEGYYYDSFTYDAIKSFLLGPLGPNGSLRYQATVFDYRTDSAVKSREGEADPGAVLLFDGVFLLRPELRDCWDYKIFLDVEFTVSVERACQRDSKAPADAKGLRTRYAQRYIPGQRIYFKDSNPTALADVIVDNNDVNNPKFKERQLTKGAARL